MGPIDFLKTVVASDGWICLARPHPKGFFVHRSFTTAEEAAAGAQQTDQQQADAYFCVSTLKEEKVWDPQKGQNGGFTYRTKANIKLLQSVFFEVDVTRPGEKVSEEKYGDRREAITAVQEFCKTVGWPAPIVVSSGGGYHFYWPLTDAVPPEEYQAMIDHLKRAAAHYGIKIDRQALDVARVLRVPGTHNYKNREAPEPVQIVRSSHTPMAFEDMLAGVKDALHADGVVVAEKVFHRDVPAYLKVFGENLDARFDPLKLRPMVEQCGAIREAFEKPDEISYHHWLHTLQVLRHCERGDELVHKVSALASSYNEQETDKMLRSLSDKDIPPTLCSSFADDTAACQNCPFNGKIKSPAALGRPAPHESKVKQVEEQLQMQTTALPPPPKPFKRGKNGVTITVKGDDGSPFDKLIYEYDLIPLRRVFSEKDKREVQIWETSNPSDGRIEIEMPASALYEKRAFTTALGDAGMYVDLNNIDPLRRYMVLYSNAVQKHIRREMQYFRMGWRDDMSKFIVGHELLTPGSAQPCTLERSGRVVDAVRRKGDIEGWKKILTFFEGAAFAGHQLAIGAGMGSILMPMTGQLGGILNMIGRSGEGKSTVQKVVNSLWGHPTELMLPAETRSSTYNAKISFITMMNNLPICAEEITNATQEEVSSLAYAITQGTEKWRADIKGNVRESAGGWCTIMLSSSNASLHEKLLGTSGAAAKALRVFEYRLQHVRNHGVSEFRRGVDWALMEHYGHAGRLLAGYVVNNMDWCKQRVMTVLQEIDTALELSPEERVWAAVLACSIVGLEIGQALGLHRFDISVVRQFAYDKARQMRFSVLSIVPGAREIMTQYLSESLRFMVVVDEAPGLAGAKNSTLVVHKPTAGLDVRYEIHSARIYVSTTAFRRWCAERNYAIADTLDELASDRVLIDRASRRRLGLGTDLPSGQVRCLVLNADEPSFAGGVAAVQTQVQAVTGS